MLILSRKEEESIIIDNNIEIKILEIEDGKVKLGIEAPKDIDIFRKEIYLSIKQENIEAAKTKIDLEKISKLFKKDS
jgi:carbon storage regulator